MQEVELKLVSLSQYVHLERPFQVLLKLQSNVDRQLGPLSLNMSGAVPAVHTMLHCHEHQSVPAYSVSVDIHSSIYLNMGSASMHATITTEMWQTVCCVQHLHMDHCQEGAEGACCSIAPYLNKIKVRPTFHPDALAGLDNSSRPSSLQDEGMVRSPAELTMAADLLTPSAARASIVACGVTRHTVDILPPRGSIDLTLSFLPLAKCVQQLSGLQLQGADDDRLYDRLQSIDILVSA